jgi:hypothetical protein
MKLLNQTYVSHVQQKSGVVDRHIRELTRDISQTTSSCQCIVILNSNIEYNTIPITYQQKWLEKIQKILHFKIGHEKVSLLITTDM